MYVCMYSCMHACTHTHIPTYVYVCMHVCTYLYMYVCMCVYLCLSVCMYVRMYVRVRLLIRRLQVLYYSTQMSGQQHSSVDIYHEVFSTIIRSLPLIQEGQLSVSGERRCTPLVNSSEELAFPVKIW